ncbi:LacI family DNA-binding transcriptional regulator [Streptomyces sp. NPDC091376]|uniref:LacI family DNA-binding transcriptional regulator n=1 Tax=Streptomyces sp. NPDC091376 TaxID=3365994 RepID=UPI003816A882
MASRLTRVAEYAGVSEATVSRVLNAKPGVAAATREAVLTALDVLGYSRPPELRGSPNRLVGLVIPEMGNPVFPAFAEVVGSNLAGRGLTPVLCTRTLGGVQESDYVDMLLEHQVSGVVFVCGLHSERDADHKHYDRLVERGLPVVAVNGIVENLQISCVSTDDARAVELATRHLASLGHQRIGLIVGGQGHVPAARKIAAFRAITHAFLGVPDVDSFIAETMYTLEGGTVAASHLLERGVTGLVCGSDVLALGAVRAARRLGLDVPADVSVVGFDDSAFMPLVDPPLTTIRQAVEPMGQAVVSLLLRQVSGDAVSADEVLFEPELVVRGSTGVAPTRPLG